MARLAEYIRRRLGPPRPFRQVRYLGHMVTVPDGVIRTPPDYDDDWFHVLAQRARVVFDVGANQGQAALIALLCPNVREAVLVEANPNALAVGAEILVRNGLADRARFVCAFASNTDARSVRLWTVGEGAAGSMYAGHAKTAAAAGASMEVQTMTLDGLAEFYGLQPDLVKIDVEGAEGLVLEGARRIAESNYGRMTLLVEMHSNPELTMRANGEAILAWATSLGYDAWYLTEAQRVTSPEPFAHRGRCHLLLQPAGFPYPECLAGIKQQGDKGSPAWRKRRREQDRARDS